jgi:autophagy-related protein 5
VGEYEADHGVAESGSGGSVEWNCGRYVLVDNRLQLTHQYPCIDNYEAHSRFANKIVPLPLPATSSSSTDSSTQPPENLGVSGPDSCFVVRSIPLKIYLPYNAPEVQDIVTPLNAHGKASASLHRGNQLMTAVGTPTTILQTLNQTLPLLFPHAEPTDSAYALATPILYCVPVPPEAEVAWLAACVAAPDGWLRIGVVLH